MLPTMDSLDLIHEFLQNRLGVTPERAISEAPLKELGVDSLMMLELVFEFEDHFGITLSKDLKSPATVGEMAALMDRLRRDQA